MNCLLVGNKHRLRDFKARPNSAVSVKEEQFPSSPICLSFMSHYLSPIHALQVGIHTRIVCQPRFRTPPRLTLRTHMVSHHTCCFTASRKPVIQEIFLDPIYCSQSLYSHIVDPLELPLDIPTEYVGFFLSVHNAYDDQCRCIGTH